MTSEKDPIGAKHKDFIHNVDKMVYGHTERISFVEKTIDDFEKRIRSLEKFKYILLGIGMILGFFAPTLLKILSNVAVRPLPSGRGCKATPFGENKKYCL